MAVAASAVALGGAAIGLASCSSQAPSTGVTRIDRAVVVAYKPCGDTGDAGIGRLDLYGSDDPEKPVWSAVHAKGQPAALDLPVVARYPGYRITDRRPGGRLDAGQKYSFDATAIDGTAWGGPGFRTGALRQGRVTVAGQDLAFAEWVDAPTTCPNVTFGGALLTGLVVAAVAGVFLVGLRQVTARGRRAPSGSA
jgi:hypothetical protein